MPIPTLAKNQALCLHVFVPLFTALAVPASLGTAAELGGIVVAEAAPIALSHSELAVIEATNQARMRHGLAPLSIDTRLMHSARGHASSMAARNSLVHTSAMVAENIAMGHPSGNEAVGGWMTSPGHRQNLLDPRHTRIGVALAHSASGTPYWCQQFR
jgi:Uncharacterized protein with SCP/PR1 domains